MTNHSIILITGPQAAGKSTVARLVAQRFERGVHIEGDVFRRFIVSGREEMAADASEEALAQLRLRYRQAASAARAFADAGFVVVYEDVVAGPMLTEVVELLGIGPEQVVVLIPSREAIAARERQRDAKGYAAWSIDELHDLFEGDTPRIGTWLDTSGMDPEASATAVMTALGDG